MTVVHAQPILQVQSFPPILLSKLEDHACLGETVLGLQQALVEKTEYLGPAAVERPDPAHC
jgi:hypothetical protein